MVFDDYVLEEARNPDWEEFDSLNKRIHDWRSYVTEEVREAWFSLPEIARCVVILCCDETAGNEEWD